MRRFGAAAGAAFVTLASILASMPASADSVAGTRFELRERTHEIALRVDRGGATLVVRRSVVNTGPRSDQAMFWLDVPGNAVATRLRTAGVDARGLTVWFEGDLMDAEEAAAKYHELTGIGGYYPKDPALLSWRHQGLLALQVFPVPAMSSKTVEYTLEMPMPYVDGRYQLDIPALGTKDVPARLRVAAAHAEDVVRVNGVAMAPGAAFELTRDASIELSPRAPAPVAGALAEVTFAEKRVLYHAHLDVAPRLGEVPARAAVAVVVDRSKSMHEIGPALDAVCAYLSWFPSAEVSVVTFARGVETPLGPRLEKREALAKLQGLSLAPQNGSNLDLAIARADALLAESSAPVRRLLVVTDLLTKSALTPESLAVRPLKSGAVAHIATIGADTVLERDDDDPWAAFPRKTGGLLWRAPANAAPAVFEEWVRPKRLSRVRVTGLPESVTVPDVLDEGSGVEHLSIEAARSPKIELTGELWSRRVSFTVAPTEDEERRWSALVFGSSLLGELTEPEQKVLAMRGHAVSPVTSYLAVEPGVRPSTEGLDPAESGFGEGGGGFGRGIGLSGVAYGAASGVLPEPRLFLERAVHEAWERCGGVGEVDVSLETNLDEVVEVGDVALATADSKLATCVREAVWALDLPGRDFVASHREWTVHARR
jgi:hypothetical protein